MKFDLQILSQAEIDAHLETQNKMLAKLSFRSKIFWSLFVLLLTAQFVNVMRSEPDQADLATVIMLVFIIGMIMLFVKWIETPLYFAKNSLHASSPLDQHLCPVALELCLAHPEFTAFQRKVAAQGRQLINGEFECMQEACKEQAAEQIVQKELAAREALRAPLIFTAPGVC